MSKIFFEFSVCLIRIKKMVQTWFRTNFFCPRQSFLPRNKTSIAKQSFHFCPYLKGQGPIFWSNSIFPYKYSIALYVLLILILRVLFSSVPHHFHICYTSFINLPQLMRLIASRASCHFWVNLVCVARGRKHTEKFEALQGP